MKKLTLLLGVIISIILAGICVFAEEVPTAKVTATLVGEEIPVEGEKFIVEINMKEISSDLFVSGEIDFHYPVDVVTPVRYTSSQPTPVIAAGQMIGGVTDRFSSIEYTGKFSTISRIDLNTGYGAIAVYIDISAEDQAALVVTDGKFTMFGLAFMLNDGYTYDDFYFSVDTSTAFLTADKQTVSRYRDGKIELESIGKSEDNIETELMESNGYLLMTLSEIDDTDTDLNVNINLLYDDEYNESVLIKNKVFKCDISMTNSGDVDAEVMCYVAEYNSDNILIGFTKSSTITVSPQSVITDNLEYTFADNAVKAKIFCWENGALSPIGKEITLTAQATDYYADVYTTAQCCDISKIINGRIDAISDIDYVKFIPVESGKYVVHAKSSANVSGGLYDSNNNLIVSGVTLNGGYYCGADLISGNTYYLKTNGTTVGEYNITLTKMSDGGFIKITNDAIMLTQECNSLQANVSLISSDGNTQSITVTPYNNTVIAEFDISNLQSAYNIVVMENDVIISIYDIKIISNSDTYEVTEKSYVSVPINISNVSDLSGVYFSVAFNETEFDVFDTCEYTYTFSEMGTGLISSAEVNIKALEDNAVIFTSTKALSIYWSGNVNTVKLQAVDTGEYIVKTIAYSVK